MRSRHHLKRSRKQKGRGNQQRSIYQVIRFVDKLFAIDIEQRAVGNGHNERRGLSRSNVLRSGFSPILLLSIFLQTLLLAAPEAGQPASRTAEASSQETAASKSSTDQASSDSRAEEWRELRRQKSRQTAKSEPGGLEKTLLFVESDRFRGLVSLRYKDFYPTFGTLSPDSGNGPGLRYYKSRLGRSPLSLQASGAFSFKGYKLGTFQFGKFATVAPRQLVGSAEFAVPFDFDHERRRRPDYFLYFDGRYRYFPEERFFGLGPDSREEDESNFLLEDSSYDLIAGYQFGRLGTAFRLGYLAVSVRNGKNDDFPDIGDLQDESSVPGLTRQPDFLRLTSAVFLDYRDTPGNPHQGGLIGVSYSRFDDRGGSEFEFNRFTFDTRGYLPLGSKQRVLALRFFTSIDDADSGSQIPFFLQRTLGGNERLRGYRESRFRDSRQLYLSAEYRWEAWPAVQFVIFYDTGKVFSESDDYDFDGKKQSVGGGVRFKTSKRTVFRFDVGTSNEGTLIHFRFGPSF